MRFLWRAEMFDAEKFIKEKVEALKSEIKGQAVIAVSGGVDSTVAAVLVAKAVGKNLIGVHVDTGFLRKGEAAGVGKMLTEMDVKHVIIDASDEFFSALKGVTEPEAKRKIIGERFIRVFEREAKKTGAKILVQGTIAPDWIESGGGLRDVIKSHHNVGALPKDMELTLVEPEGFVQGRGPQGRKGARRRDIRPPAVPGTRTRSAHIGRAYAGGGSYCQGGMCHSGGGVRGRRQSR
jgi:GMP synthase PP-ATPase subunit